jgi:1,4-alpha-glucan branching enzyme
LTTTGSTRVPAAFGHLSGAWDAPSGPGPEQRGHLAFAQEFIPGVEDAWRVALVAASSGTDFTGRAHELGVVTAEIHQSLAATMGSEEATADAREALLASMQERYAAAVASVPELGARASDVDRLLEQVRSVALPPLQRIHGDYHLGQVLDVPERGWVALDFEGEPLRPLAERVRPDLVQRDMAGMLRSFDYAAGSVRLTDSARTDAGPDAWAADCRRAFLEGYQAVAGEFDADSRTLIRVLELDKALYEVVYEARNRPAWLPIPVEGVDRILSEKGPPG